MIKKADMSNVEWSPGQKATPKLKKDDDKRAKRKGTDSYYLAISEYNRVPRKNKSVRSGH